MKIIHDTPDSSSIASYSYDIDTSILEVKFKSGVSYRYFDVDKGTFVELQVAPSIGNFIATRIKKFEFEKVEDTQSEPWPFPKAEDFEDKDLSNPARWPFPTGPKPAEESYDKILEWTVEEEEEFMRIVASKDGEPT